MACTRALSAIPVMFEEAHSCCRIVTFIGGIKPLPGDSTCAVVNPPALGPLLWLAVSPARADGKPQACWSCGCRSVHAGAALLGTAKPFSSSSSSCCSGARAILVQAPLNPGKKGEVTFHAPLHRFATQIRRGGLNV